MQKQIPSICLTRFAPRLESGDLQATEEGVQGLAEKKDEHAK